jgi:hypothetical protein
VGVVVLLEAIEVEDRDTERGAVPIRARDLTTELLVPRTAVEQAREVVGPRRDLEPAEQLAALDRDRSLEGEQLDRARRVSPPICSSGWRQ